MSIDKSLAVVIAAVGIGWAAGDARASQRFQPDLDFEAGGEGWTIPKPNWSVVDGAGRNGSRGLVWTGADTNLRQIVNVSLPFKPGEKFRVTGWVLNESLSSGTPNFDVYFEGEKGYLDGTEIPRLVSRESSRKGEWVQYAIDVGPIPPAATRCLIGMAVSAGVTGRCVYDDFEILRMPSPFDALFYSSAPNDQSADGRVRFVAQTYADLRAYKPDEVEAFFTCEGEEGMFRVAPELFREGRAEAHVDVKRLKIGPHAVLFNVWTKAGRELDARRMTFTRLAKPVRGKVWFDEHHRMIVDGKPIYPLLNLSHPHSDHYPRFFPSLKASPFKMLLAFMPKPNKEYLDYFHTNGISVFVSLSTSFAKWPYRYDLADDMNAVDEEVGNTARIVMDVKDHPALLGWYLYDEPTSAMMPRLRERYKLVKALDGGHPCLTFLNQPQHAEDVNAMSDVSGIDEYPIPGSGTEQKDPGDLGRVSDKVGRALDFTRGDKPFWFVVQAYPREPERARFPTVHELRAMVWQAIAAGAGGILFNSLHELLRNPVNFEGSPLRKKLQRDPVDFEKSWADTCTVAQEVKDHEDFLLSIEPPPVLKDVPKNVVARAWRLGGRTLLVAVNTTHAPVKGTLTLDGRPVAVDLGGDDVMIAK